MKLPLNKLEKVFQDRMLDKGLDYYERGLVGDFHEIDAGLYAVVVNGTNPYQVHFKADKAGVILDCACTCPFDHEDICKHEVAAFLKFRSERYPELATHTKSLIRTGQTAPQSYELQLSNMLKTINAKELTDFVLSYGKQNREFGYQLISTFSSKYKSDTKEQYIQQIREAKRNYLSRKGFWDYEKAPLLVESLEVLLERLQANLVSANFKSAIMIISAIIDELYEVLQNCDDSLGVVGNFIDTTFAFAFEIERDDLEEEDRKCFFETCLAAFRSKKYKGWDWHVNLLEIAAGIYRGEKEFQEVYTAVMHAKSGADTCFENELEMVILDLLVDREQFDDADNFMEKNLDNPLIRRAAIDKAIENDETDRAWKLLKDGINDKATPREHKHLWYSDLYRIACSRGEKREIIECAKYLLTNTQLPPDKIIATLQEHFEEPELKKFFNEIINETLKENRPYPTDYLPKLLLILGEKKKLIGYLEKMQHHTHNWLGYIKTYEDDLKGIYSAELCRLYEIGILNLLHAQSNRNAYEQICRYLRRIKKLGGKERAEQLVETIRASHGKKKLLMQELAYLEL